MKFHKVNNFGTIIKHNINRMRGIVIELWVIFKWSEI
jgi:hypothetical protein